MVVINDFYKNEIIIDIDEDTQEPIYKSQVIFIGEYYGVDNTNQMMIENNGIPWVKPDGSTPVYKDKNSANEYEVIAGQKTAIKAYYNLKSEWNMGGHGAGTDVKCEDISISCKSGVIKGKKIKGKKNGCSKIIPFLNPKIPS